MNSCSLVFFIPLSSPPFLCGLLSILTRQSRAFNRVYPTENTIAINLPLHPLIILKPGGKYVTICLNAKATWQEAIRSAGRGGPAIGSVLGLFPQCGFSTVASNLYAGRIITMGTLLAVFLSTSDEMLPIMISENVGAAVIFKILAVKVAVALTAGFAVDFLFRGKHRQMQIEHLCEQHHCHCENGVLAE